MTAIERLKEWAASAQPRCLQLGATLSFFEDPDPGMNPITGASLRLGNRETELLLWESGEAEYSEVLSPMQINQEHFECLTGDQLEQILARMLASLEAWSADDAN